MTLATDLTGWNLFLDRSNGIIGYRNMTGNRKRSRDDEACEFMPLSKRINNLHINNNLNGQANPESSQENGIPIEHSSSNTVNGPTYDPGVNPNQSVYYNDNKLLFELHLERIQRTGQQFPF